MPYKPSSVKKLYYTIGEVAAMFDVNTSLIRFWEKEFDVITPTKNKKGNRYFTTKDIDNFKLIYHLLKERGFTIKGAKDKLRQNKEETIDHAEIVKHLQHLRAFLVEIREQL
ncbi:MAG: MerR family transcriptional regulator [Luteibaculaceae bacterium]